MNSGTLFGQRKTVADPGFPVGGGHQPVGGALTSDTYTFRQKCMRKQKKLILFGGACRRCPPGSANERCVLSGDTCVNVKSH